MPVAVHLSDGVEFWQLFVISVEGFNIIYTMEIKIINAK